MSDISVHTRFRET